MKKFALILLLTTNLVYAQKQNNFWYFGNLAGIDFNSGSPVALTGAMSQSEGCATISDALGNLLFYTNGMTVWNANHIPMPNGFGLLGHKSSTQSALIIPKPLDCKTYYIFTSPAQDSVTPLSYSVVDMNLDGGMGDVVSKNISLYNPVTERLTGTVNSNGKDYWVISQKFNSNGFLAFSVTSSGVDITPIISYAGPQITANSDQLGYMKISPDGSKLCYASLYGSKPAQLFDFDNTNGIVSNPIALTSYQGYGVEFSPDNSKLYIETGNAPFIITQYNLLAGSSSAIQSSATEIVNQYIVDGVGQYGGALQLGPDDKIYINRLQKGYLGAINQPNLIGALCNYVDSAIYLAGNTCQDGLPNCIKQYFSCSDDPTVQISSFTVPNAFSPNNNGKNDIFLLQGWGNSVTAFSLIIYDRWGEKVFESSDPEKGWDGTYKGKLMDPGVFVYYINAIGIGA